MKKVLLTGSSGFIGSHLLNYLVNQNYALLGIDKKKPQNDSESELFQACDLLDCEKLKRTIADFSPDIILHLAARIDLEEKKDIQGYAANIQGVNNLIDAIRQTPSVKRCIFTSSQLVCKVGYIPKHDRDYSPNTLYGQSKVLTEKIVRENDGGGVEWCIVRPTTVWGAGMNAHYQKFFKAIKNGRYFHVSDRPLYKSYSYVGNIVHQYAKLMEAPVEQIHGKTFYLADYEPLSLRSWVDTIQKAIEAKPVPTYPLWIAKAIAKAGDIINNCGLPQFPFNSFRLNNIVTEYQFDLSETKKVCGELPYTVEQGVKETTNWLKEQAII